MNAVELADTTASQAATFGEANGFRSDEVTLFQFRWVGYGYGGPCL
jgi:hypothetical protein